MFLLIKSYQRNGFIKADLDPLKLDDSLEHEMKKKFITNKKSLEYQTYGFTESDLDKKFNIYDGSMEVRLFLFFGNIPNKRTFFSEDNFRET